MLRKYQIKIKYKNCIPIDDNIYCECERNYHPVITTNNVLLCEKCIRPIHPENFNWQGLKNIY